MYPNYIDSKKTIAEGRRIPRDTGRRIYHLLSQSSRAAVFSRSTTLGSALTLQPARVRTSMKFSIAASEVLAAQRR